MLCAVRRGTQKEIKSLVLQMLPSTSSSVAPSSRGAPIPSSDEDIGGAVLFIGNLSTQADSAYLARLFSAYGTVKDASIAEGHHFALVTYHTADDADCAIAALHLRYCMAPSVPILVMYSNTSSIVSEYGKEVSAEYRNAISRGTDPHPVPLTRFDAAIERGAVQLPPSEIAPPPIMSTRKAGGNPVVPASMMHQQGSFPPGLFP